MARPKSVPDPLPNDVKDDALRTQAPVVLLPISLAILALVLFRGTLLLRRDQPDPGPPSLGA